MKFSLEAAKNRRLETRDGQAVADIFVHGSVYGSEKISVQLKNGQVYFVNLNGKFYYNLGDSSLDLVIPSEKKIKYGVVYTALDGETISSTALYDAVKEAEGYRDHFDPKLNARICTVEWME